jgi:hypothetical protein
MWTSSRWPLLRCCFVLFNLKREQVQADTVWAQQDVPITVHAFLQTEATPLEPSPKRACQSDQGHCIDFSPCLSFYVRAADHPGKFDVEAAKKFALVPKLHYAALKRGETVIASEHPPSAHAFVGISLGLQLTASRFMRLKLLQRPHQGNRLPLSITTILPLQYSVKALALVRCSPSPTPCCISPQA